jgi:hypothetical protein
VNDGQPSGSSTPSNSQEGGNRAPAPAPKEPRRWGWLVPAATFLLGLALAGIVVSAQNSGSSTASSGGSSTVTVAPTTGPPSSPVAVVEVPAACLSVADDAKALVDVAATAVTAARNLDASALSAAVRQLDDAQKAVTSSADACRAVQATLPSTTAAPSPTT